jgi:hypothetical protein
VARVASAQWSATGGDQTNHCLRCEVVRTRDEEVLTHRMFRAPQDDRRSAITWSMTPCAFHRHPNLVPVRPGSSGGRPGISISRLETFTAGAVEHRPCRREVAGRVSDRRASEVDDAAQPVVAEQQVGAGDVAVDPDIGAVPLCGESRLPHRERAVTVDLVAQLGESWLASGRRTSRPGRHG